MWKHSGTGPIKFLIGILEPFLGFVLRCWQLRLMPLFIEFPLALPSDDKYNLAKKRSAP